MKNKAHFLEDICEAAKNPNDNLIHPIRNPVHQHSFVGFRPALRLPQVAQTINLTIMQPNTDSQNVLGCKYSMGYSRHITTIPQNHHD